MALFDAEPVARFLFSAWFVVSAAFIGAAVVSAIDAFWNRD